jgi:hypothetical protein
MDRDGRTFIAKDIDALLQERLPAALCDKCIALALGLSDAHQAELRTERLAEIPGYQRTMGRCSACGKRRMVILAYRT